MKSCPRQGIILKILFGVWVFAVIATPIALWIWGDRVNVAMISIGVLIQFFLVAYIFWVKTNTRTLLKVFLPLLASAWAIEMIGVYTGLPFGRYSYTQSLQPQLLGVPLLIPLAWAMMLPPAWEIAARVFAGRNAPYPFVTRLGRSGVAALAFTAWDLFLDPQMVSWGFWVWETPGLYFGIPLVNYLGWFGVSFILSVLLMPDKMEMGANFLVYGITWILTSIGQILFWNLWQPGIVGFLSMGGLVSWAHFSRRK
jgi:putative membrane protein